MKCIGSLVCFLFLGYFNPAIGQQKKIDSLLVVNNQYPKEDSLKIVHLKDLFRAYGNAKNLEKFKVYADSAILIASRFPQKKYLASVYMRLGSFYHITDRLQAITNYRKGIEAAEIAGAAKNEGDCYLNLGALYNSIRDYPASLDAHEKALGLYASVNDKDDMTSCYINIATIYNGMEQRGKAIEYARKALTYFDAANSNRGIGVASDVLGSTYLNASDAELREAGIKPADKFRVAEEVLEKGLKSAMLAEDEGLVSSFYADFGWMNELAGKNETALSYYLKAVNLSKNDQHSLENYAENLRITGTFYLNKIKDPVIGKSFLYQALAIADKIKQLSTRQDALMALSGMHEAGKNYDSALVYYRLYITARDNISTQEREQEITRKQLKLDFNIKEREYKETQQLTDAKLKQQVLLARQREQELLVKKQQLEISDKEKSLQQLMFLKKQTELEGQKKNQANQLVQEKLKADYDKKILDQQINVQQVQLVLNKRVSIFLGVLAIIVFAVALFIFISRRKMMKLNRKVSEQKSELEEMGKVKDKIFSIVSHDMRTPVNNLFAFRSILEDGKIEQDKLLQYIDQVKGTLDHTSSMMENLLNWAASQMQGFTPMIETITINTIVSDIIEGIRPSLQKKNILLDNQLQEDIIVSGDRNMIELIIRNLLSNAIKFSRQNGKLELFVKGKSSEIVTLSIRDNGVGLSETKMQKINSTSVLTLESTHGTAKEKGTGLGLMLCKHFALLMHGKIKVESAEGKGSVFSLVLPVA
ncbi:MAG: ATP-binding protein [Bacteroidota bacterium]